MEGNYKVSQNNPNTHSHTKTQNIQQKFGYVM